MEVFLKDQCKTVEFREKMENIETVCQVEKSGSSTLKEIYLLVFTLLN